MNIVRPCVACAASSALRRVAATTPGTSIGVLRGSSTLVTGRRSYSQQVNDWVGKLMYGSSHAPFFGSHGNAYSVEALATRQLYCKALVYTTGGSRSARDWIAGSTALSSPNQALLHIALQYNATEADVWQLRASFMEIIFDREDAKAVTAEAARTAPVGKEGTEDDHKASAWAAPELSSSSSVPTDEDVLAAESFLLSESPEVRCFLFDAMTASLFNANTNVDSVERRRQRIFHLGRSVFGVSREVLTSLWRVAQADLVIRKEKQRAFGQTRME